MGAYRGYPNRIQDYEFDFEQIKHKIKTFNSLLARKLFDEEEEEKAVLKILEEEL